MGGRVDASDNFVEPTILDFGSDWDAFRASKAMEDEIFGPVLPMIRYGSLDDVIGHVCAGEKPLCCRRKEDKPEALQVRGKQGERETRHSAVFDFLNGQILKILN